MAAELINIAHSLEHNYFPGMDNKERIRKELIEQADQHHRQYAQYKNHFDHYILVRIKKDVRTKMGQSFLKDDVCIARTEAHPAGEYARYPNKLYRVVYSFRTKIDTSIPEAHITVL